MINITRNVLLEGDDGWEWGMYEEEFDELPKTPMDRQFPMARFMCLDQCNATQFPKGPHHHHTDDMTEC
eukprot:CAMPEP_0116858764 /NCGR_PEP_ID=MMETSP0418-20121206/21377_1 /TAXON_ID=1158023 /ORGANISM="Astrosyne radiata, Strain 13vi08-1A" /LENGTH=68 /DNA_ID=CAMNT_0004492769 /DNA_START=94 /DNA_END=300 /DNA_ORIENTATION=+